MSNFIIYGVSAQKKRRKNNWN